MADLMAEIVVEKERGRSRYRAKHRASGRYLSGWQGSPDQALTSGEAALRKERMPVKIRRCLRCGGEFLSEGPGHRLCSERCRQTDGGPEVYGLSLPGSGGRGHAP